MTSSKFYTRYPVLLLWLPDWLVFILLIAVAIFTTSRNFSYRSSSIFTTSLNLQVTTAIGIIFFVDVNST